MFRHASVALFFVLALGFAGTSLAQKKKPAPKKETWPVKALTFTITAGNTWTPTHATVPVGAEVKLTLENKSTAPACFEIGHTEKEKWVKSRECVDVDQKKEVTFFANVPKGTYPIRNAWEAQQKGDFIVE